MSSRPDQPPTESSRPERRPATRSHPDDAAAGLPPGYRSVPLPEAFLEAAIRHIKDPAELRASLWILWRLQQVRRYPRAVRMAEVLANSGLNRPEAERGMRLAVRRGTFLSVGEGPSRWLVLNDEGGRRWAEAVTRGEAQLPQEAPPEDERNIFRLYEDHFGWLNPALVEELKEAEASYPWEWLEEAFDEAVQNRAVSWRYVASVLKRWEREGKQRGSGKRHPDTERLRQLGRYSDYVES